MSVQRLSPRSIRRVERATGETIVMAWANGGYIFDFVTPAHRHGWYSKRDGSWGWEEHPLHYTSCFDEFFPEEKRVQ
jgi:reverse gyrase